MATKAFEQAVEIATGVPVEVIRDTPVDERWATVERALGRPLRFPGRYRRHSRRADCVVANLARFLNYA